jgi:hypothetical protein
MSANGLQEGHLQVGVDGVRYAIDLDLWHEILSGCYENRLIS